MERQLSDLTELVNVLKLTNGASLTIRLPVGWGE